MYTLSKNGDGGATTSNDVGNMSPRKLHSNYDTCEYSDEKKEKKKSKKKSKQKGGGESVACHEKHSDPPTRTENPSPSYWQVNEQQQKNGSEPHTISKCVTLPKINTPEQVRKASSVFPGCRTMSPPNKSILGSVKSSAFKIKHTIENMNQGAVRAFDQSLNNPSSISQNGSNNSSPRPTSSGYASNAKTSPVRTALETETPLFSSHNLGVTTPVIEPVKAEESVPCSKCHDREVKIRSDYDRMIILSKREKVTISSFRRDILVDKGYLLVLDIIFITTH